MALTEDPQGSRQQEHSAGAAKGRAVRKASLAAMWDGLKPAVKEQLRQGIKVNQIARNVRVSQSALYRAIKRWESQTVCLIAGQEAQGP